VQKLVGMQTEIRAVNHSKHKLASSRVDYFG